MNEKKFNRIIKYLDEKYQNTAYVDWGMDANNPEQHVVVADWNNIPDKFTTILEDMGVEVWWSDQYGRCEHCSNLIDLQPSCYGWEAPAIIGEWGYVCQTCVELIDDEYELNDVFDEHIYEYNKGIGYQAKAVPSWAIYLFEKFGWQCWSEDNEDLCHRYESGWFPGQNDDPEKVFKEIMEIDNDLRVVFAINSIGQFDVRWNVWIKPKTEDD